MTVGELGEFALIARITAGLPAGSQTVLGPGDDAAVVRARDGRVVVSTDLLVEGVHFRTDWSSAYDVGRKAAAANLADIAAMGARPTAMVVGLALPAATPLDWCDELTRGLVEECGYLLDVGLVGGDIVRSDRLTISVTVLGDLEGRAPVTRAGARPGDVICLLGPVGGSAAGQALLERADPALLARHTEVVRAHRSPTPAYTAAADAAEAGARAMIDVSDGLAADLVHLAAASGVRLLVEAGEVPQHPGLAAAAADLGLDPFTLALTGGEDHAFAVVLPRSAYAGLLHRLHDRGSDDHGRPLATAAIGRVLEGSGVVWQGWIPPAGAGGHDHFATDPAQHGRGG